MITITILLIAVPVILIIALFKDTAIHTSAAIIVNQPRQVVFDYLASLKNQERYNAWLIADDKMNIGYSGQDGHAGSILWWTSKHKSNGNGAQRIIGLAAPQTVAIEITFEQPMPTKARYYFELFALNDRQTRVTWTFEGNSKPYYLLRVTHLLFRLKKRVNHYMELSLKNIKDQLEDQPRLVNA
jgi:hypothetical protein